MTCFLPRSKGDRQAAGVTHKVPALSRLCPVEATQVWLQAANVQDGPVFRAINQWGHVSAEGLHPNSLVRLLRELLASAGFADAGLHSSHSLRRGFASWANDQGWDMKALMEYVGWRDVQSAMRYRTGVTRSPGIALKRACPAQPRQLRRWRCRRRGQICPAAAPTHGADPVCPRRPRRGQGPGRIEEICLAPFQAVRLNTASSEYRLTVPTDPDRDLDEIRPRCSMTCTAWPIRTSASRKRRSVQTTAGTGTDPLTPSGSNGYPSRDRLPATEA